MIYSLEMQHLCISRAPALCLSAIKYWKIHENRFFFVLQARKKANQFFSFFFIAFVEFSPCKLHVYCVPICASIRRCKSETIVIVEWKKKILCIFYITRHLNSCNGLFCRSSSGFVCLLSASFCRCLLRSLFFSLVFRICFNLLYLFIVIVECQRHSVSMCRSYLLPVPPIFAFELIPFPFLVLPLFFIRCALRSPGSDTSFKKTANGSE